MTRLALALLLVGCAPALRGATAPPADVSRALDLVTLEWRTEMPYGGSCSAERQRLVYHEVDEAEMRYQVGWCATGSPLCEATRGDWQARAEAGCALGICSAGSMLRQHSEPWPIGLGAPWRVRLIVSRYMSPESRLSAAVHEYAHALAACSLGDADVAHRDYRIWAAGGIVSRATARVMEAR